MTAAPDARRRELAQIHIAKQQLGLDDDTYRAMLFTIGRVRSAKELNLESRQRVLEHLRARGFVVTRPRAANEWAWVDSAAEDKRKMLRKIIMQLKSAGRGKAYVDGMCETMFRVERLEFCSPDQLHKIVSALNIDARRVS